MQLFAGKGCLKINLLVKTPFRRRSIEVRRSGLWAPDVTHLQSSQEEADTKMLLHALDATADGASEIHIYFPDMDVVVPSLRRYPDLCETCHLSQERARIIE